MDPKKIKFWFWVLIAATVIIGLLVLLTKPSLAPTGPTTANTNDGSGNVPFQAKYDNKIVYTSDMSKDPAPYKADCDAKGGEFKSCGSICAPDAQVCAQICAYTCEFGNNNIR